tara:strand:+ start:570 stop:689 length:120 start_codon:yes stop_codon:yes gene_type:complete
VFKVTRPSSISPSKLQKTKEEKDIEKKAEKVKDPENIVG